MAINFDQYMVGAEEKKPAAKDTGSFDKYVVQDAPAQEKPEPVTGINERMLQDIQSGVPKPVAIAAALGRSTLNVESPEELIRQGLSPMGAATVNTAQKLISPVISGGNAMLAGVPQAFLNMLGEKRTPAQDIKLGGVNIAPAVDVGANVAGFVRGPLKAAGKAVDAVGGAISKIPGAGEALKNAVGNGIIKDTLKGGLEFGLATGINNPEGIFDSLQERGRRAVPAAIGGAVFGATSGVVKKLGEIVSKEIELAKQVRGAYKGAKSANSAGFEGGMYEAALKSNGAKADVSSQIAALNSEMRGTFAELGKKSSDIRYVLNNPEGATAWQLQKAINAAKSKLSRTKVAGRGLRSSDQNVKSAISRLEKIQEEAFPMVKNVKESYGKMADALSTFENLKTGNTLSSIRNALKDPEKANALKQIVGDGLFKRVKQYAFARSARQAGAGILGTLIKYGIIYNALQRGVRGGIMSVAEPMGGDGQ